MCQCSCGNTIEVSYSHLNSGHTCSCGCSKSSYGERKIRQILEENKICFIQEYIPQNLYGINGGHLRFDFAIIENNNIKRLIEFDGPQHSKFTNFFNDETDFLALQEHDKRKNDYSLKEGIPLVRIPYQVRNKITIEDILTDKFLVK